MKHIAWRQHGQALAWFVVVLPLFLSIVGLAIDGEAVLRAHRRAQGAADGAARTGARGPASATFRSVMRVRSLTPRTFWIRAQLGRQQQTTSPLSTRISR